MDTMIAKLTAVEVLETKHVSSSEALGRAFKQIEEIEYEAKRIDRELQENLNKLRGMKYLAYILWTALTFVVGFLFFSR